MAITNSQLVRQTISRPVNGPDFLITADDLAAGPAAPPGAGSVARGIIFATNSLFAYPGLAGPGTIEQGTTFTYNKVGPIYANFSGAVYFWRYAESAQQLMFLWGSYDGSTNAPIVYPNGTTHRNGRELHLDHDHSQRPSRRRPVPALQRHVQCDGGPGTVYLGPEPARPDCRLAWRST